MTLEQLNIPIINKCDHINLTTYNDGFWTKNTYDMNGKELRYDNFYGHWNEYSYDKFGNQIRYESSSGYWSKKTYDMCGNRLTFEDGFKFN